MPFFGFLVLFFSCAFAFAQVDSTIFLFDDSVVHEYSLTFYDADFEAQLQLNYANDGGYIPAKFSDGKITIDSVGVRYKGNSSYSAAGPSPKKPLKIKFNKFVSGQKYYGSKILNFSNGYGDPTLLREKLTYDVLANYMPSPRATFATIKIGSNLIGLYTQIEQIDEEFLERHFTDFSLNLFKASDAGASLIYEGASAASYAKQLELKTNEAVNNWSGMIGFLDYVNASDSKTFCKTYSNYMNPDNAASFFAFAMAFSDFDSYVGSGRNFYLYQLNSSGYMSFIPWDLNLSFGGYSNGWDVYKQSAVSTTNMNDRPLFKQLMACEDFQYKYLAYIRDMITKHASTDAIQKAIDKHVKVIESFVEADPNKFFSFADFSTNLKSKLRTASGSIPGIIEFSTTRNAFLSEQIDGILPEDYNAIKASPLAASFKASIHNGNIILSNLALNKGVYVEFFTPNGKRLAVMQKNEAVIKMPALPKGMILIRIQSGKTTQILKYNNF